jgi:hypothetical protein
MPAEKKNRPGGKKSKAPDNRPARKRYWLRRTLEMHKVKKMMRAYGLTEKQAIEAWRKVRKGRVPDMFMKAGR